MPRMRTINQAFDYIHDRDDKTALTKNALRKMVVKGNIPSVRIGNRYLIDLDALDVFFASLINFTGPPDSKSDHNITE